MNAHSEIRYTRRAHNQVHRRNREGLRRTYQLVPTGPIYVYLCTGEVRIIRRARGIRLRDNLMTVVCEGCGAGVDFVRQDVFFCSQAEVSPPILF